jgi:hypothetical protein
MPGVGAQRVMRPAKDAEITVGVRAELPAPNVVYVTLIQTDGMLAVRVLTQAPVALIDSLARLHPDFFGLSFLWHPCPALPRPAVPRPT